MNKKKRPWNFKDLTGQRFGKLIVIEEAPKKNKRVQWECQCDCGNKITVRTGDLNSGHTQSCGCLYAEIITKIKSTHGLSKTPEYDVYFHMKGRCYDQNNPRYKTYGARGITICDGWLGEDGFINFINDMGRRPSPDHTIERVDNDKGYSPDNCVWLHKSLQNNNKTSTRLLELNGEVHSLKEWSEIININRKTLSSRINQHNWSIEKALTTPIRKLRNEHE